MYYFTLLFLLCFITPVLITTSLNVYISSAVRGTVYSNISNHQWLTLAACVVMWLPCLTERMLSKMGLLSDRLSVSVFLFLLGHTHNLLRYKAAADLPHSPFKVHESRFIHHLFPLFI